LKSVDLSSHIKAKPCHGTDTKEENDSFPEFPDIDVSESWNAPSEQKRYNRFSVHFRREDNKGKIVPNQEKRGSNIARQR
jgi:hypothetical protein